MNNQQQSFLTIALSKAVVKRSLKVGLIVGTILAVINHGQSIVNVSLSATQYLQVLFTYMVPYCVSTYASVDAIRKS